MHYLPDHLAISLKMAVILFMWYSWIYLSMLAEKRLQKPDASPVHCL
jgi:hypothetical protein